MLTVLSAAKRIEARRSDLEGWPQGTVAQRFDAAFAKARKAGQKTFTFKERSTTRKVSDGKSTPNGPRKGVFFYGICSQRQY